MNGYVPTRTLSGLRVSLDPAHGGAECVDSRASAGFVSCQPQLAQELARLLESHGVSVF